MPHDSPALPETGAARRRAADTGAAATVLIIDDVASEAMTIELMCRAFGCATLRAADAAEAGALLASVRPAAIITDLVMPGADGLDCLFMIAESAPDVPVMAVTAADRLLLKAAGELGGGYGLHDLVCVPKPLAIDVLRAFLRHAGLHADA